MENKSPLFGVKNANALNCRCYLKTYLCIYRYLLHILVCMCEHDKNSFSHHLFLPVLNSALLFEHIVLTAKIY